MAAYRAPWSMFCRGFPARTQPFTAFGLRSPLSHGLRTPAQFRTSVRHQSQWPFRGRPQYYRFGDDPVSRLGPIKRAQALWSNHPRWVVGAGGLVITFYVYNLETVEISGRRRFNVLSPKAEEAIFQGQYENVLEAYKNRLLPASHPYVLMCKRVVARLVHANGLENQKWVIHVVKEDQANAFCLPGGQIFVFTGLFPYTKDEDGLAAVLGHEIAHKVARHHAEQLSGRIWGILFMLAASLFIEGSSDVSRTLYSLMFDLRNNRTQESEADHLGLLMMAKGCYDPRTAVTYWQRMVQMEHDKRQSPPEFLSTHPASDHRVKSIEDWMPDALEASAENDCTFTQAAYGNFSHFLGR